VFNSAASSGGNTTFSFTSHNNIYSVSGSYTDNGVVKQDPTMTLTPSTDPYQGFVGIDQTFSIALTSPSNLDPIQSSNTWGQILTANSTCGTITNQTIDTTANTASLTITAPSTECLGGTLTVTYTGNSFFNTLTKNITLNFKKHTASFGSVSVGGSPFSFNTTSNKAKTATDYAFVIPVIDGDGAGHTNIPIGTVKVSAWNNGTSAALVAGTNYQITCTPACTYDGSAYPVTLDASGNAAFTVRFLTVPAVPANPIVIKYEYPGSAVFFSISSTSTSEFNIIAGP
jgi:hypothetical protein